MKSMGVAPADSILPASVRTAGYIDVRPAHVAGVSLCSWRITYVQRRDEIASRESEAAACWASVSPPLATEETSTWRPPEVASRANVDGRSLTYV
jgi:hypothetical protein